MKKFNKRFLTAVLAGTLLFSTVPSVYGAELNENQAMAAMENASVSLEEGETVTPTEEPIEKAGAVTDQEEAVTETPEVTVTPEPSKKPEVTVTPEPSKEPEVTPEPEQPKQGWNEKDGEKFYLDANLKRVTGWKNLNGIWYYFDTKGTMQTGWITVGGKRYYLNGDGKMQVGWVKDGSNWYFTDASGAMQTGWLLRGHTWYYLNGNGVMAQGWVAVGGRWYYLRPGNGDMMTGWVKDGSTWYYMSGSGAMQTGWLHIGNTWYYLNGSGAMQTGWKVVGGAWYYFNTSGAMQTGWLYDGAWYYLGGANDGAMKTGWINDGRRNYYLKPNGVWKNITIAVVGYNNGDAATAAAKVREMGASAVIVTGAFDPSQYDGMIIPGGGDLDPSRYGQANTASKNIDNALDDRQIDAVKKCAQAGKPVLGICKGIQLINVAFGGTLNQNISGHMGIWHAARVVASGWFSSIYSGSVSVLSFHHQSIQTVASGFQVDMRANDGTIEAISNNAKQIYGVQFHPEQMNNDTGNRCIKQFVATCTK